MPNTKSTKKKKTSTKKTKKKGFTLVELLAVIIILAIVVGITIPAVLTTTANAKQKALEAEAQSMADWIDKQYQAYKSGAAEYDLVTLDASYLELCVRNCRNGTFSDYTGTSNGVLDTEENACSCEIRVNFLTENIVKAAGLKAQSINISAISGSQSLRIVDGTVRRGNGSGGTAADLTASTWNRSRVYINKETGKSCVTLKTKQNNEDYPSNVTVCGGTCISDDASKNKPDYCKPTP